MKIDVVIPSVGESITEGTISRWFKEDGDAVEADEPLYELETEKATTEVPAPASGVLHIAVQEGENVEVGAVVGDIDESAEPQAKGKKQKKTKADRTAQSEAPAEDGEEETDRNGAGQEDKQAAAATQDDQPLVMPAARRLIAENDLDPGEIQGTGRGGRITKEDVQQYLEKQAEPPSTDDDQPEHGRPKQAPAAPAKSVSRERMSSIRQRISERMVASQKGTASLTTFNEADLSAVLALRRQYKESFQESYGVSLGLMTFFVKACVEGLRRYPIVNARIDGSDILYHNYYHIGIAVSTERGLMVPVLRDADRMNFAEIEKQIAGKARKAREGKISVDDLQGGTFTITNGGVFGSLLSTPILNPPQSAILGMHTIQDRPVAVDKEVVIRPMMYLALTYDHRLIDGRDAVQFLVRIKECIEDPQRLLLEV